MEALRYFENKCGTRSWKKNADFKARVLAIVRGIQSGTTLSYGEVARRAGSPRAARTVGNILSKNYDPSIPCHRVIRAGGSLGGYNNGAPLKRKKLAAEGVSV